MKKICCLSTLAVCSWFMPALSTAAEPTAVRVLIADCFEDRSKSNKDDENEVWAYRIVLQNNSKNDLTDLEIRYRIFHFDELDADGKPMNPLTHLDGKVTLSSLKKQEKKTVNTHEMDYGTGGNQLVKADRDVWKGIWIRVFNVEGVELGSLVKPASFAKSHPWK